MTITSFTVPSRGLLVDGYMARESHQPEAWLEPESKQSACLSLPAGVAALGKGSPEGVGGTFGCQHSGWERERVGVEDIVPPLDPAMPEVHPNTVQLLRPINSLLCVRQTELFE